MIFKGISTDYIEDIDDKNGVIKGYASVFDVLDSDNDVILKGAYKKTLQENGSRVRYVYQHDMAQPLGKFSSLYEDNKGLMFEAVIPPTTLGKDFMILVKNGVVDENSVGILPTQKKYNSKGVREISENKLFEISGVTLAACEQAKITDAKGNVDLEKVTKRFDNLARIIRKENITDDLGYAIESELMKLKSLYNKITVPFIENTQPIDVKNDSNEIVKYLLNNLSQE